MASAQDLTHSYRFLCSSRTGSGSRGHVGVSSLGRRSSMCWLVSTAAGATAIVSAAARVHEGSSASTLFVTPPAASLGTKRNSGARRFRARSDSLSVSSPAVQRSRWCKSAAGSSNDCNSRPRDFFFLGGRGGLPRLEMTQQEDSDEDEGGENEDSNSNEDDEDIDWGTIRPKEGQKPDWDKILPKSVIENTVDMPPPPPGLANLDPRERLMAYAGLLDWQPLDLDEEEPKEKTYEALNEEMEDEWLANKLQLALLKNRNVEKNVNKAYINEWLDEEKEDLEKTAEKLKAEYAKDAERIQREVMEEFDKGARVMDIKISNIIARGKGNFSRTTGPLSETTPFPSAIAAEFATLAEDEAAFYEELGVAPPPEGSSDPDIMTPEERNQIEAELSTLSPSDVIKAAAEQARSLAQKNASAQAMAARRIADSAGDVVVVGGVRSSKSDDGHGDGDGESDLGAQILALFDDEAGEMEGKGVARVTSVEGISITEAKGLGEGVKNSLAGVKTLVIVPADSSSANKKKSGSGFGAMFGGGGGGDAGSGTGSLTDGEASALIDACGDNVKHVVCLSVGSSTGGGGGGGLFGGGGGSEEKGFPGESSTEQGVIRKAKAKGLSYTTVRVSKLGEDRRAAPLPLITPKNTPRPEGMKGSRLPEASRSVVANTIFRASYQPESRRNSTFAVSDFPETWSVPASGWADEFVKLSGPELLRVEIPAEFEGGSGTFKAWSFLREWSQLWTRDGTGLTTRVKIFSDDDIRRAGLYFDPSQTKYLSAKEEKEAEERNAATAKSKGASGPQSRAKNMLAKEGGIDIVVEDKPYPRVRVVRANMGPKTVVKEMSEQLILDRLKKDIKIFITEREDKKK